jgi:methionine-rich copper-binding protein CopC
VSVGATERSARLPRCARSTLFTLLVVLAVLVPLAPVRSVVAHAEPRCTNPTDGAVVATAPAVVEIWFSEDADPSGTTLTVLAPDGTQVDQGDTQVDLYDPQHEHVTVSLPTGLGPGTYAVRWHSLSAIDGDEADGSFAFTVALAGTPGASPVPARSPLASPQAAASPVATPAVACR